MALSHHHFLISSINFLSILHLHYAFLILPITKHLPTHQYIAKFHHATPLVVDLNAPFLWTSCSSRHVSSSHRPVRFHCDTAKAHGPRSGPGPGRITLENPITREPIWADLVEDILTVGSKNDDPISTVHHNIIYYCSPTSFFKGLSGGAKGVLGLGRARTSVQSQLAMSQGHDRKFAICLSSSKGFISFGVDILKSLTYTPLINNGDVNGMREYFINVKSVKISGERINLSNDRKLVKISTVTPFTTLHSSIYSTFIETYTKFATSMNNMTRVKPVPGAPFEVCFRSENIGMTPVGPAVPVIDLVMQSELVKWRIHGRNSMVRVSDEIMCLGFLNGGSNSGAWIVIGGYQLEDNLLQFDIATSMIGFSSSLLARNMSCSNFDM